MSFLVFSARMFSGKI